MSDSGLKAGKVHHHHHHDEITAIPDRYFNREQSWLKFNERVLEEACNPHYPLLERLRFLSISGSNLDEFLMVRVAGLAGQVRRQIDERSIDGLSPTRQLERIRDTVARLEVRQQEIWSELQHLLADEDIKMVGTGRLGPAETRWLKSYFMAHVLPVLTPQAIDPAHPFPFITNQGMGLMFSLARPSDGAAMMEMV